MLKKGCVGMKIAVVGYASAGKSTFTKRLGKTLNIPILHIDRISFESHWVERDRKAVEIDMRAFMEKDNWVIDGSYTKLAPERFEVADLIFIFKFNRFKCLFGAFHRWFKYRHQSRDSVCDDCTENLNLSFIWWILYNGRKKRRRLTFKSYEKKYPEKVIIFKSHKQVHQYLRSIGYTGTLKYE